MSRIPADVAEQVELRAWGYCEACGGPLNEKGEFHHRHARGMGGAGNYMPWIDTAVNLMLVHSLCHNLHQGSIHQRPDRSHRLGHIVSLGVDPATIPVVVTRNLRDLVA